MHAVLRIALQVLIARIVLDKLLHICWAVALYRYCILSPIDADRHAWMNCERKLHTAYSSSSAPLSPYCYEDTEQALSQKIQ